MERWSRACALLAVAALAGCGGSTAYHAKAAARPAAGAAPWALPAKTIELVRRAGLKPERREFLQYHVHAHLDVFVNGRPITIPAGLGIEIADPGVQRGRSPDGSPVYGGIQLCLAPCISPLHTHDDTGILHTESKRNVPNRLGQLFTEWGVRLDRSCVGGYCEPAAPLAFFVNGKRYGADPRQIELKNRAEVAVVIGSPPAKIPSSPGF